MVMHQDVIHVHQDVIHVHQDVIYIPEVLDTYVWANRLRLDSTEQSVASDQGLHCLYLVKQSLRIHS